MYETADAVLRSAGYQHYEVSNFAKIGRESRHNQVYWAGHPFFGFGVGATSLSLLQRQHQGTGGVAVGAGRKRLRRPRSISAYKRWVEALRHQPSAHHHPQDEGELAGDDGWADDGEKRTEAREEEVHPVDTVIGQLRTSSGLERSSLIELVRYTGDDDDDDDGDGDAAGGAGRRMPPDDAEVILKMRGLWPYLVQLQGRGLVHLPEDQHGWLSGSLVPSADTSPAMRLRLTVPDGFLLADEITADIWARLT